MLDPTSDRTTKLRAALAARLERVRGNMSDEDFARLVADIARTALRFEEIDARERSVPTPLPGTLSVLVEWEKHTEANATRDPGHHA